MGLIVNAVNAAIFSWIHFCSYPLYEHRTDIILLYLTVESMSVGKNK